MLSAVEKLEMLLLWGPKLEGKDLEVQFGLGVSGHEHRGPWRDAVMRAGALLSILMKRSFPFVGVNDPLFK